MDVTHRLRTAALDFLKKRKYVGVLQRKFRATFLVFTKFPDF